MTNCMFCKHARIMPAGVYKNEEGITIRAAEPFAKCTRENDISIAAEENGMVCSEYMEVHKHGRDTVYV